MEVWKLDVCVEDPFLQIWSQMTILLTHFKTYFLTVDVSNNTSSFEQSLEDERFMDATSSGIVTTYCECCGFVIVGDNLDKNFRPSHQREDRRTRSMHIFHSCAIKNRVDVSSLSDKPASAVLSVDAFLLNSEDIHKLQQDFEIMISR